MSDAYAKTQTVCQVVMAALLVAAFTYWFRDVLIPFALSVFLALNLRPLVTVLMERCRVPRWLAIVLTFLLGMVLVAALAVVVAASISDLGRRSDAYLQALEELWTSAAATVSSIPGLNEAQAQLGIDPGQLAQSLASSITARLGNFIGSITSNLLYTVSQLLVVLMFLGFLLASSDSDREGGVAEQIVLRVKQYVVTKTILSVGIGVATAVVLGILRIDLAMVFGMLAFVLNYIPNFGPIIATLVPLPVILFAPGLTPLQRILALVIPGVMQFICGNVMEPQMMGDSLDLDPVVILLTLMLWGALWGPVGMFLATPITAIVKILCEQFESTQVLANLMAGRLVVDS